MTSEELRKLARDTIQRSSSIDERGYAVIRALNKAADDLDEAVSLIGDMLEYVERAYDYSFPDAARNDRIRDDARDFLNRLGAR